MNEYTKRYLTFELKRAEGHAQEQDAEAIHFDLEAQAARGNAASVRAFASDLRALLEQAQ